jgi:hypothetical protein
MIRNITLGFATFALAIASAASSSYKVDLLEKSVVNGNTLPAGQYKVEVNEDKAVISHGKTTTEAPVKVETVDQKYSTTSLLYGANSQLQEVHIGGTKTKLIFNADNIRKGD